MPIGSVHHSKTYDSDYEWHLGGWVTPLSAKILDACVTAAGWGKLRLAQGGLNRGVKASAETHWGLDVVDIAIDGRSKAKVWLLCAKLKRSGILPFPRGYGGDPWRNNRHIHAVRYPAAHAHPQAAAQVTEYLRSHGDGLVGSHKYVGPGTKLDSWGNSPYNPSNVRSGTQTFYVTAGELLGLNADRVVKHRRKRRYRLVSTHQVYRWGRWNAVTKYGTYYSVDFLSTKKPN